MAHVAHAELARDDDGSVGGAQFAPQHLRHVGDGGADAASRVQGGRAPGRLVLDGLGEGIAHVVHVHEVAAGQAVFEEPHGFAPQQLGREDREDAGVGVEQGLAGAVHVLQPKRRGRHAHGRQRGVQQVLLRQLGGAVDGRRDRARPRRGGGHGFQGLARRTPRLPAARLQIRATAGTGVDDLPAATVQGTVRPLAVHGPRRSQHHPSRPERSRHHQVAQDGRAARVRVHVVPGAVHRLAGPGLRGKVHHHVGAVRPAAPRRRPPGLGVPHVAAHEAGALQLRVGSVFPVNPGQHRVQHGHLRPCRPKSPHQPPADEPGASGDENPHAVHGAPPSRAARASRNTDRRRSACSSLWKRAATAARPASPSRLARSGSRR